jgi:hypothetical protein
MWKQASLNRRVILPSHVRAVPPGRGDTRSQVRSGKVFANRHREYILALDLPLCSGVHRRRLGRETEQRLQSITELPCFFGPYTGYKRASTHNGSHSKGEGPDDGTESELSGSRCVS